MAKKSKQRKKDKFQRSVEPSQQQQQQPFRRDEETLTDFSHRKGHENKW